MNQVLQQNHSVIIVITLHFTGVWIEEILMPKGDLLLSQFHGKSWVLYNICHPRLPVCSETAYLERILLSVRRISYSVRHLWIGTNSAIVSGVELCWLLLPSVLLVLYMSWNTLQTVLWFFDTFSIVNNFLNKSPGFGSHQGLLWSEI